MNFQCIEYSIEPESTHLDLVSQHKIYTIFLPCIDICCIHLAVIQYIYYDTLYSKSSQSVHNCSWKNFVICIQEKNYYTRNTYTDTDDDTTSL